MRARQRAPAEPRPRRRRYRIDPGWPGVATSIVRELADLLPPPMPEEPFAFFEADDAVRRYRRDGSLRIDTAEGTWCDDRTGEGGGIYGLLVKLLRSRQAAREWVRFDHEEEWNRPWPPRRGPPLQRRPTEPDEAEVPLSAVLGRESVAPPPPPSDSPQGELWPDESAEAVIRKNIEAAADEAEEEEREFREELAKMTPREQANAMSRLAKSSRRDPRVAGRTIRL